MSDIKESKRTDIKTIAAVIVFLIVALTLVILTVDLAKTICFTIFNLNIYLTASLVIPWFPSSRDLSFCTHYKFPGDKIKAFGTTRLHKSSKKITHL